MVNKIAFQPPLSKAEISLLSEHEVEISKHVLLQMAKLAEHVREKVYIQARDQILAEIADSEDGWFFAGHGEDFRIRLMLADAETEELENHPCSEGGTMIASRNLREMLMEWAEEETPESIRVRAADFRSTAEMLEQMAREREK